MRFLLAVSAVAVVLTTTLSVHAQSPSPPERVADPHADGPGAVDELERLHRDSMRTRRALARSVLIAGLVSVVVGGTLIFVEANDQAWRFAGINTAVFGGVNTVVGLRALHGITREDETWESEGAIAARRTPEGLTRARIHAAIDERRESVGHAINLGLGCAYVGVGGTAILASQLGVDHPKRWLASGIAVGFQAVFLIGLDFVGLARSSSYHRRLVEGFAPSLSITPTSSGSETRFNVTGTF
jgi:hypothetical protein